MDSLLLAVVDELGRGVAGVLRRLVSTYLRLNHCDVVTHEFDLINSRGSLEPRVGEKLLEILDGEVGNTNVLDAAAGWQLLHLGPGVKEIPIGVVLLEVIGVGAGRPVLYIVRFCTPMDV